jgi:acyl-ACP thioesterase
VHIDPAKRLPSRLPAEFEEVYGESAAGRRPRKALRHPVAVPADAERLEWRFSRADVDLAGHVNNAAYWRVAEEYLDLEAGDGGDGDVPRVWEVEYRAGIDPGPAAVARAGSMLWISDPEGELAATIAVGGGEPAGGSTEADDGREDSGSST